MVARHHTKDKGDLAVAKVLADLVARGACVLLPLTEHAPFDLVAYLDDAFYRVQVKFRTARNGTVRILFQSSWADRHGTHTRPMSRDEVDVLAVYCPDTERCYYLNPADFRVSVSLRVEPVRNGQVRGVLPVDRFVAMPPAAVRGARVAEPRDDASVGEQLRLGSIAAC